MLKIDYRIQKTLEELFEMNTGYILDFSNSSFQRFVLGSINLDIYFDPGYEEYTSKANKLRQILKNEPEEKVATLITDLVEYYEDFKLKKQSLTEYDKKKIYELKEYAKDLGKTNNEKIILDNEIDEKMKIISTRNACFNQMTKDEKLKEICNMLEYLLKSKKEFISLDYETNSMGYLNGKSVAEFRKKIQCFRHSSKESIEERENFSEEQKDFLIEYGVLLCNFVYRELKRK